MPWRNEMLMYCWPVQINLLGALSCKCEAPNVSAKTDIFEARRLKTLQGMFLGSFLLHAAVVGSFHCQSYLSLSENLIHLIQKTHYVMSIRGFFCLIRCHFRNLIFVWSVLACYQALYYVLDYVLCRKVKTLGRNMKERSRTTVQW